MRKALIVTHENGTIVQPGDTVTDFRGDTATFVLATRARIPGKSGLVVTERTAPSGAKYQRESYDGVFDLIVTESA